jgi:hypothetical protein
MKKSKNIYGLLSMICIIIGAMSWVLFMMVPSLHISGDKGFPIWLLTLIINPVGLVLSLIDLRIALKQSKKQHHLYSLF